MSHTGDQSDRFHDDPKSGPAGDEPRTDRRDGDAARIDYHSLFENAPDAILVVDREGRYIAANRAASELTGYSRTELFTKRVGDLTAESERKTSQERFDLLKKTGRTRKDRLLKRKNGKSIPVEAHAVGMGDGHYLTVIRDISKRIAAQQSMQRSMDAYSTLVDLCNVAVVSAGPDGRITSWNPAAETLFGYSAVEIVGLPISMLIPPAFRNKHLEGFGRHLNPDTNEPFFSTLTAEGSRKDGTTVPIDVSTAVGTHGGERVFTAAIHDITEQRDLIERLNDALQKLQFHVERMPLAYIVWDAEFRVVEWNPAAHRMFGFSRKEAIGVHCYDLIVPADVQPLVDDVWEDLLKGDTSSHATNRNVRKDGSYLTCEWFNTPLRDSEGKIRGVASMAMDVSEREMLEARIRDAQRVESVGVLAGGMAHDFNSSLMVILGNSTLLRSLPNLPAEALEHLDLLEEAGGRAKELIKHLLTYARTGKHNPEATDLNQVIREAKGFVHSSMGKEPELEVVLSPNIPDVLADKSQVERILLNLCFNAKQAMSKQGTIIIETKATKLSRRAARHCVPYDAPPGLYSEITVTDTGCGMDETTVTRVFDPFFTTRPEGHGLGLAAVLGIVRQHSAFLKIDSTVKEGTTVHVYFPPI